MIMKQLIFISILILTFCLSVFTQQNQVCPKIELNAPTDIVKINEKLEFSVLVSDAEKLKLQYSWTISVTKEFNGQGTSTISFDTTGLENQSITATVEISGLPKDCKNSFSGIGNVQPSQNIDPSPIDTYQKVSWGTERNKLDNLMLGLNADPRSKGFIEILMSDEKNAKTHIGRILGYLKVRGMSRERILYRFRKNSFFQITLWIVPEGAKLPGEN